MTVVRRFLSQFSGLPRIASGNFAFEAGEPCQLSCASSIRREAAGRVRPAFTWPALLPRWGQRVLLIDADPQGSLSQGFLGSSLVENLERPQTTAAALDATRFQPECSSLIRATQFERIFLLPANQHLAAFNAPCPESSGLEQYALRNFLRDKLDADIVLIDCPPNLYRCSWSAMVAADYVVIPVPPEDFGTQGLRAVHQAIDHARLLNPTLRNLGHLVTRSDSRLLGSSRLREPSYVSFTGNWLSKP